MGWTGASSLLHSYIIISSISILLELTLITIILRQFLYYFLIFSLPISVTFSNDYVYINLNLQLNKTCKMLTDIYS